MSSEETTKRPEPNEVLIAKRGESSRAKLAAELEAIGTTLRNTSTPRYALPTRAAIEKQIYRLEKGYIKHPDELYKQLYCIRYNTSPHELFGDLTQPPPRSATFSLRNHKLIPNYIGADLATRTIERFSMQREPGQGVARYRRIIDHSPGETSSVSTLWAWPFGVALFHVVETLDFPDLASLAVWHRTAYDKQMAWAQDQTYDLLGSTAPVQYAMPINWLFQPLWSGDDLNTAMRVISMPRILLRRNTQSDRQDLAHAQLVERSLFKDGFDHPDVADFGLKGISAGIASWSGVVYCPIAPEWALSEDELLSYELTVQATWSYCDWIRREVEAGRDAPVRKEHGRRLLRALRSIIINPRPEESAQMYPLRLAFLETSGIVEHLRQAAENLAETEG